MTSHEFAQQLLAGPDLPIFTPRVKEYDDDEDTSAAIPTVSPYTGEDINGDPVTCLIVCYKPDSRPATQPA